MNLLGGLAGAPGAGHKGAGRIPRQLAGARTGERAVEAVQLAGRPTLPAVERCPTGTSVSDANKAENAFLKLLVFSRTSDGSRMAEYTARSSDRVNWSGKS